MLKTVICLVTLVYSAFPLCAQPRPLYLLAGQSNAVGKGNKDSSVCLTPGVAAEYRLTQRGLVPLADPVGEDTLSFQVAGSGSIGPAFAQALYTYSHQSAILVAAAKGGASCSAKAELEAYGTWDTTGNLLLFDKAIRKTQQALQGTGASLQGILWMQGERDANAINNEQLTAGEYRQSLERLIVRFRSALGRPVAFYIVQTGYYAGFPHGGFDAVRKAQEQVSKSLPYVYLAYRKTGDFPAKGWMTDAIHYNQAALNDIGATVGRLAAKHLKH